MDLNDGNIIGNINSETNLDVNTLCFQPTINLKIEQSEWCSYKGECKKNKANIVDLCYLCKHRIKLDIPAMLDKAYEEQNVQK